MRLFYEEQANQWEETLPIGNGSLGAMIWGGTNREHIGLNHDSLWSGYYRDKNRDAFPYLQQARDLIINRHYAEADDLIRNHMLGEFNESYLPLGDLLFAFNHTKAVTDYKRILDITSAIATVSYRCGDCAYERTYFASYPSQALFMHLACSESCLDFSVAFDTQLQHSRHAADNTIVISLQCPEHVDPSYLSSENPIIQGTKGMVFDATFRLIACDGETTVRDNKLCVKHASYAWFSFSKAAFDPISADYAQIKRLHIEDYQSIYNKVDIYLGDQLDLPTNKRLENLRNGGEDNGLYALYFQYGRYLLISASRSGSQPANLQGIWNWHLRAPWSCNWTTNINTQMNYWPAQICNLSECIEPYIRFVKEICEEGKKTARAYYRCRGFTHHHNADFWRNTNPVGIAYGRDTGQDGCVVWAFWPMGGAWLTAEIFKHYEYNPDPVFLSQTVYPILKEAVLFLVDWVYEYDGCYITCPSTSPENSFFDAHNRSCAASQSSAMDLALIREVFGHFKTTCALLAIEDTLLDDIDRILAKLAPFKIGSQGQLLEWDEDFKACQPGHRHFSHLYGLFPSELFEENEALTNACRVSLMERLKHGSGHTGWSCAWIINLFAILGDAENAAYYLKSLLTKATHSNLWGDHPPFQIDANFGGTAAIAHMLVQERNGKIKILPALPKAFDKGYVKGLRLKNGKTIDIHWDNGKLTDHSIY